MLLLTEAKADLTDAIWQNQSSPAKLVNAASSGGLKDFNDVNKRISQDAWLQLIYLFNSILSGTSGSNFQR